MPGVCREQQQALVADRRVMTHDVRGNRHQIIGSCSLETSLEV